MSVDSINVFRTALVKWEGYKIACQVDSDKKGEEFEAQFAKRQASFLGDFASCKTPSSFAGYPEISAFAFREGVRVLVLQRQGELQVSDKKNHTTSTARRVEARLLPSLQTKERQGSPRQWGTAAVWAL